MQINHLRYLTTTGPFRRRRLLRRGLDVVTDTSFGAALRRILSGRGSSRSTGG